MAYAPYAVVQALPQASPGQRMEADRQEGHQQGYERPPSQQTPVNACARESPPSSHTSNEELDTLRRQVEELQRYCEETRNEQRVLTDLVGPHWRQQQLLEEQHQKKVDLLSQLFEAERRQRREAHNKVQELMGNIRVVLRIRPASQHAAEQKDLSVQSGPAGSNRVHVIGNDGTRSGDFVFDKVFGSSDDQITVFDEVSDLVQSALDGYKVCIFAYGQTGSGKTYTMQGAEKDCEGIIPRALSSIFLKAEDMRQTGWAVTVKASFLEVYNEELHDLLRTSREGGGAPGSPKPKHAIVDDEVWGTIVPDIKPIEVSSIGHMKVLMAQAAKQRSVGSTLMNEDSSRSHYVFALYLTGLNRRDNSQLNGALHLVDLAGSERLDRSGATGERLKETQSINKSLSSLVDVFVAKAEGHKHVPFRNSTLAHLMKPCLSGQGKTLMFVNISPDQEDVNETLCSLRFAAQVARCDTGGRPKKNCTSRTAGSPSSPGLSISQTPGGGRGPPQTPGSKDRSQTPARWGAATSAAVAAAASPSRRRQVPATPSTAGGPTFVAPILASPGCTGTTTPAFGSGVGGDVEDDEAMVTTRELFPQEQVSTVAVARRHNEQSFDWAEAPTARGGGRGQRSATPVKACGFEPAKVAASGAEGRSSPPRLRQALKSASFQAGGEEGGRRLGAASLGRGGGCSSPGPRAQSRCSGEKTRGRLPGCGPRAPVEAASGLSSGASSRAPSSRGKPRRSPARARGGGGDNAGTGEAPGTPAFAAPIPATSLAEKPRAGSARRAAWASP